MPEGDTKTAEEIVLQPDVVRDLILRMVQAMVNSPESVSVDAILEGGFTTYRVPVAQNDLGYVIGKQGRNGRSLRVILSAISMKEKRRMELDIVS